MTDKLRQAAQQALEAYSLRDYEFGKYMEALRAALAEQPAEPVAYIGMIDEDHFADVCRKAGGNSITPLYTAPQPAKHPFLVRDLAELIGSTVHDVCNALEDMGIEPRRSTNAAVTPDEALAVARRLAKPAEQPAEPVAYMHCPSVAMDGKVRPVLSFEKYEGDYASGIYAERIPLYAAPQPTKREPLTREQAMEIVQSNPDTMTAIRMTELAHGIGEQE